MVQGQFYSNEWSTAFLLHDEATQCSSTYQARENERYTAVISLREKGKKGENKFEAKGMVIDNDAKPVYCISKLFEGETARAQAAIEARRLRTEISDKFFS